MRTERIEARIDPERAERIRYAAELVHTSMSAFVVDAAAERAERIITDQRARPVSAVISVLVAIFTGGYMLPWAIAAIRGKSNHWLIFWVNLLLGWTFVGWVIALVLSVLPHRTLGVDENDRVKLFDFGIARSLHDPRLTEQGELRRHVNVFVGDESIKFIDGLETRVTDGTIITIVPAVSGG